MRAPGEGNYFLNIFYIKNCGTDDAFQLTCGLLGGVHVLGLGSTVATAAP